MKRPGQVAVFRFPQTDLEKGKPRPALLIAALPGSHEDWLACMISTKFHQALESFDETIDEKSPDFTLSGLKAPSVIRISRLAVVRGNLLTGTIGEIAPERLQQIRSNLADWIMGNGPGTKAS